MPSKLIYLDHAAATPVDKIVLRAMTPYFSANFYNPSATYSKGLEARQALNQARSQVAAAMGAKASEITFTAGGSEANNLAIAGVMNRFNGANLVVSAIEHESVLKPAANYDSKICPVKADGLLDIVALEQLIDDQTVLVSIMYVSNEIGTVEPVRAISRLLSTIRLKRTKAGNKLPIYLHTDACQAANYLDLHASRLGVDLMTINGGKLYGPKQSGALFIKTGVVLSPLIYGGGQEHGLRSGTENVAAVIGLSQALAMAQNLRKDETKRLEALRDDFIKQIVKLRPDIKINGSLKNRVANNIHLTIPGVDNEWLLIKLDEVGILAAAGSACSASSELPSHVLSAIGLTDQQARSSIRLSLGRMTTSADMNQLLAAIKSLV